MASAKLQKTSNETCSQPHEEHKFSHKISEITAWGTKVFGHKQPENQAVAKHCNTCNCVTPMELKPAVTKNKKENTTTVNPSTVNKEAKHHTWLEFKKKEKQNATNQVTKEHKEISFSETKKKEKQNTTNASNKITKKDNMGETTTRFFSSMADQWKGEITMKKKTKDAKSTYSSSEGEDETFDKKKKEKRHQTHEMKATSK